MKRPLDCMKDWWKYDTALQSSEKSKPSFSLSEALSEAFHALAAWRQTSLRVLLGANPSKKSFSQYCIEDVLWTVLALTVWWQWGLSVWGPHSWLWKYDVVSRCIWGCTSLPLSIWSVFKPRRPYWELYYAAQGTTSSLWLRHWSLCELSLCLLSLILIHSAVTGNAPCLSLEDQVNSTCPLISRHPPDSVSHCLQRL